MPSLLVQLLYISVVYDRINNVKVERACLPLIYVLIALLLIISGLILLRIRFNYLCRKIRQKEIVAYKERLNYVMAIEKRSKTSL